jgi:hypothetical protein
VLQAASVGGHEKIIGLLLSKSAEINAQGGLLGNALQATSVGGHEQAVELLLSKGTQIDADDQGASLRPI